MKKLFTFFLIIVLNQAKAQCVQNSNSLSFNGTSSSASIPVDPLLIITNSITIEAWVNAAGLTTNTTPTNNSIVCHHGWQYGEQGYVLRAGIGSLGTPQISFNIAGIDTLGNYASWQQVVSTGIPFNLNTWYHVAGTYDGDSIRCYINGAIAGVTGFKGTIRDSSAYNLSIGKLAYSGGGTRYWNGKIDEVRMWNRALSATELQTNMSQHIDPSAQTGLIGYWRFNEGSGSTFSDLSGNNLSGSLSGTAWSTVVPFNIPVPTANLTFTGGVLSLNPPATSYVWYFNGSPLPNDTLQSLTPTQNGLYYAMVSNANGCTALSGALNITNVGIAENDIAGNTLVYYHSESDMVMLQLPQETVADKIIIYDNNGRVVSTMITNRSNQFSFSCSTIIEGLYVLNISTNRGIVSKRIMVMRQ